MVGDSNQRLTDRQGRLRSLAKSLLAAVLIAAGGVAGTPAKALELALPVDCTPGENCWVIQYADMDPGPGRLDYMCGWLSYDDAIGTDIAVADLDAMNQGVAVLAAAGGTVIGARHDMDDVDVHKIGKDALKGKDCGNGVNIDHGDGWTTQYCHLRRNSVAVRPGDTVAAGQRLGLVGLSGNTEFPHLEITVRHLDTVVDPFVGTDRASRCGVGAAPLWRADVLKQLAYRSVILNNAGFASAIPTLEAVRAGLYDRTEDSPEAAALIFWVDMYWPRPGDRIRFQIRAPDGQTLVDRETTVDATRPRDMFYAGVRYRGTPWPSGQYQGEVTLVRDDGPIGPETYSRSGSIDVRSPKSR
jgi:Peptidase family M23